MITMNITKSTVIELNNLIHYNHELVNVDGKHLKSLAMHIESCLHFLSGGLLMVNHNLSEINHILNTNYSLLFIYSINCGLDTNFDNRKLINALNHTEIGFTGIGTEMKNLALLSLGVSQNELTGVNDSDAEILHEHATSLINIIKLALLREV